MRRARNVAVTQADFHLPGPRDQGGRDVPLELSRLQRRGADFAVADPDALALIAAAHHLDAGHTAAAHGAVRADYEAGQRRGVRGSPHFFIDDDDFFCPALDLGRDADGQLTARFDSAMLADFFARVDR